MIKRIYKILAFICMSLVISGILHTSCKKDNSDDAVTLKSYGPSPVLRGGELKFIGSNLDKVSSVVLPNHVEVTTFKTKTSELLVIEVPQETVNGSVTLKTPQGDIEAKTLLGISEPIAIDTIVPAKVKPGAVITITGNYLNLIKEVIFADKKSVTSFQSQSKTKLEVVVPGDARTGKVVLSNGNSDPILVEALYATEVTLPTITDISPNPVKAGSQVTIKGTDLDLAKEIIFGGGKRVTVFSAQRITVFSGQAATQIDAIVPEDAKDGSIKLVMGSGVEVTSSNSLTMVVPTITEISPNPAKNNGTITVTGTNLDLVSSVTFGGNKEGQIQSGGTASQIVVSIPADAISGNVTFGTKAGKSVVSEQQLTLKKPVIASIDPITTAANQQITITGTDLDVVKTVKFTGGYSAKVTGATSVQIVVNVTAGSVSGPITLVTTNGEEVVSSQSLTIVPNVPVISSMPTETYIGTKLSIVGTKLDLAADVIFPGNIKATMFGTKSSTLLEVYVPASATKGIGKIQFVTVNNEIVYSSDITIKVLGVEPVLEPNLLFYDFDAGDASIGWNDIGSVENDPTLSISGKYYHVNATVDGSWKAYFARNWGKFSTTGVNVNTYAVRMDINILEPVGSAVVLKFRLKGSDDDFWYVWKVGELYPAGTTGWITVSLPLTGFLNNDGNGPGGITDVSKLGKEFDLTSGWGAGKINMCVDNVRFEKIK